MVIVGLPISIRSPAIGSVCRDANAPIGEITEAELKYFMDQLDEESSEDDDYYIDVETLELLAEKGAPRHLLDVLERALSGKESAEVRWTRA